MVIRRGVTALGCLVMIVIVAAIGYFGANVGRPYLRYYRFKDAMQVEARFAAQRTDAVIRRRLRALADSLRLPEGARNITVRRANSIIFIYTEYYEQVEFPGFVKEVYFSPQAQGPF
jgi:hypothetical protein